jgi:hypothetical protein
VLLTGPPAYRDQAAPFVALMLDLEDFNLSADNPGGEWEAG